MAEASPDTVNGVVWLLEEKKKFVEGLVKYSANGVVNWNLLKTHIGKTKTIKQVKEFAKHFNALEKGTVYPEFNEKAAIDVWRHLAVSTAAEDKIADMCIPQVLTVAALEPLNAPKDTTQPNYTNIYNYLSAATRDIPLPKLSPIEATIVLEMLEDLVHSLSDSETLIQKEFLHQRYAELRNSVLNEGARASSSTNPFVLPFEILEFTNLT